MTQYRNPSKRARRAPIAIAAAVAVAGASIAMPTVAVADDYRTQAAHQPSGFGFLDQCYAGFRGRDLLGGALGAVVGGLLGAQIGDGSGQLAATATGTLLGAVLGGSLSQYMDPADGNCVSQSLEYASPGQTVRWTNPNTRADYAVTPSRVTYDEGRYCREYTTTVVVGGKVEDGYGRACRQPDGSWELVS